MEKKAKNLTATITILMTVIVVMLCGCSNLNSKTKQFLNKANAFAKDSMPGNASKICVYADSTRGNVFYVINDEENSKYDNETDYYPTLYIYDVGRNECNSIDIKGGLYSPKKQEISIKCVKGFKAINNNKNIIIVGTNNDHMGRGLIAVNYDILKNSFDIICESLGGKIWIDDDKISMQIENGGGNYSYSKISYDFNGKEIK